MVQADSGKNAQYMIRTINVFLSKHSLSILIALDYVIKFWAVLLVLAAGFFTAVGILNIFFWSEPVLGFFQLTSVFFFYRYMKQKQKASTIHSDFHFQQEAIGGLVDVLQKTQAPSSFFNMPPKKKNKLPN